MSFKNEYKSADNGANNNVSLVKYYLKLIMQVLGLVTLLLTGATLAKKCPSGYERIHYQTDVKFDLSKKAADPSKIPFEPKVGAKPFTNYLQQTLDFSLFKPLFDAVNKTVSVPLQSRGEAHITVITPPEFDGILSKAGVTMQEINDIALKHRIQELEYKPRCVGRDKLTLKEGKDEVYNVVVSAPKLEAIREDVFDVYVAKGGEPSLFDPKAFWPHITLGFNIRDAFPEDGVYKGVNSCWAKLNLV
jgi:hypothetical protein